MMMMIMMMMMVVVVVVLVVVVMMMTRLCARFALTKPITALALQARAEA